MNVKSVIAGEYTAPPAHGPMMSEICGTTPDARTLRYKSARAQRTDLEDVCIAGKGVNSLLSNKKKKSDGI